MIIPLTRQLSMVEGPNNSQYPYCICLYIDDEIRALIDTGCSQNDLDYLVSQHIDVVINSHFHEDHILNNRHFTKAEIWAHPLDAPAIRSMDVFLEYYGISNKQEEKLYIDFLGSRHIDSSPVHREFQESEVLNFGKVNLSIVFAPGHTPGHCCFFDEKEGILFSSDINLSSFGPWYAHACSNLDDFIDSIVKCMTLEPRIVITSHNGIIQDNISARFRNNLDTIFFKEEMVRNALAKQPSTLEELEKKNIFYNDKKKKYNPLVAVFDKMAVERHLARLIRLGEVKQDGLLYHLS